MACDEKGGKTCFIFKGSTIFIGTTVCNSRHRRFLQALGHAQDRFALHKGSIKSLLLDEVMLMDDDEVRAAILRVLRKLAIGDQAFASPLSEYQSNFLDHRGIFGGLLDINTLNLEPHK